MNIKEIPQFLFDELSKKFGRGEEIPEGFVYNGNRYRVFRIYNPIDLRQSKAIGITKNSVSEDYCFALWQMVPEIYESQGIMKVSSKPIASVFSKDHKTLRWINVKGHEIEESVFVRIEGKTNVTDRFTLMIFSLILKRASELEIRAKHKTYWTKDWVRPEDWIMPKN